MGKAKDLYTVTGVDPSGNRHTFTVRASDSKDARARWKADLQNRYGGHANDYTVHAVQKVEVSRTDAARYAGWTGSLEDGGK